MSADPDLRPRIRAFSIHDYGQVHALWESTPGIGLSSADQPDAIASYLSRNPGLSSIAHVDDRIVGAILSGHDGRRGFLHHLVVHPDYRGRGIGKELVMRSLDLLAGDGIQKCHIFVFGENQQGQAFWSTMDFESRHDISLFSRVIPDADD